jgi:hypothetical protein
MNSFKLSAQRSSRAYLRFAPALSISLSTLIISSPAWSFAEDVCYLPNGGGVADCTPLPAVCKTPFPNDKPACLAAATATFAAQGDTFPDGGRSSIHTDATNVMAQAIGFPRESAYWIAAYDQATDLGDFEPKTMNGAPFGDGTLKTATLDGIARTRLETGGVLFHFGAPRAGANGIDGLHPDVDDPQVELFLSHLRSWAAAGAGTAPPECAAGLTVVTDAGDYANGTSCYATAGGPFATVSGSIAAIGDAAVPFTVRTGPQIIVVSGGLKTSDMFDGVVGSAHAADARLGVYAHALGDRISHHVCVDASSLAGPSDDGADFVEDLSNRACAQGPHALRHMWETGVDFSHLAPIDRTTEAALVAIYDELVGFARARGVLRAGAESASTRDALVGELVAALETANAGERLLAVRSVACARNLAAFPGLPPCTTSAGADAGIEAGGPQGDGAPSVDTVQPASENDGCSIGSPNGAGAGLLVLVLGKVALLASLRRWRRSRPS